jgi:hypothetical protein
MASVQAHSAQHDSKWPSDSPTWPHMVPGYTKMPSRQLQTWPEDSPRRVTMNFSTDAKQSLNTSTKFNVSLLLLLRKALSCYPHPSQPTDQPTKQPTSQSASQPTNQPTNQPTSQPTSQPANQPTNQPTNQLRSLPGASILLRCAQR